MPPEGNLAMSGMVLTSERQDALPRLLREAGYTAVYLEPARVIGDCKERVELPASTALLFCDPVTAGEFVRSLASRDLQAVDLDNTLVCAIGTATIEALSDLNIHADVKPFIPQPQAVLAAIDDYVGEAPSHLLVVGGDQTFRAEMTALCQPKGRELRFWPDALSAWHIPDANGRVTALLLGGAIEAIHVRDWLDMVSLGRVLQDPRLDGIGIPFYTADPLCQRELEAEGKRVVLLPSE